MERIVELSKFSDDKFSWNFQRRMSSSAKRLSSPTYDKFFLDFSFFGWHQQANIALDLMAPDEEISSMLCLRSHAQGEAGEKLFSLCPCHRACECQNFNLVNGSLCFRQNENRTQRFSHYDWLGNCDIFASFHIFRFRWDETLRYRPSQCVRHFNVIKRQTTCHTHKESKAFSSRAFDFGFLAT